MAASVIPTDIFAYTFQEGAEIPRLKNKQKEQVIKHEGYTVSYNSDYKIANWVAYELTSKEATSKKPYSPHAL